MASKSLNDRDFRDKYRGKNKSKPHFAQKHLSTFQSNKINSLSNDALVEKVSIYRGSIIDNDITTDVDAVVNPANERLWADGSGVCGAIFNAAGYDKLQRACNAITSKTDDNSIPDGQTAVTHSYDLNNINWILHTIAPCEENNEDLISCYISVLELCVMIGIRSVAFPCIGTGDGNFSKQSACSIALRSVRGFLSDANNVKYKDFMQTIKAKQWHNNIMEENSNDEHIFIDKDESVSDRIEHVIFCCFDEENWNLYNSIIPKIYPSCNDHSYIWIDRIKSIQYENEISCMRQHIDSLEMENKELKSNDMQRIYTHFIQEKKGFNKKYNEQKVHVMDTHKLITMNKDILNYSIYLQKMKEEIDEFIQNVQDIKQCISAIPIPNTKEYKKWNVEDIIVWILSKENGKFAPYIEQLKAGFVSSEIMCGDTLTELTRSDLSVPPFSINSFPIKRELIHYFQSLKTESNDKNTEGNDTNL